MSDSELKPPFLLREYKEVVQVQFCYDDVCLTSRQLVTPINVPECPVVPQVTLQCLNSRHDVVGPKYVYDWEKEEFVEFNERLHDVPKSSTPVVEVDPPSRQIDMSASSEVELESESDAMNETPQLDEDDDVDIDDEDLDEDEE